MTTWHRVDREDPPCDVRLSDPAYHRSVPVLVAAVNEGPRGTVLIGYRVKWDDEDAAWYMIGRDAYRMSTPTHWAEVPAAPEAE